ncbi:MAG: hypothetical protein P5700_02715 [Arthrospira platensis PCC 7345]|nr:hypothetical protein [Arthrospira platensis PCC 7345]
MVQIWSQQCIYTNQAKFFQNSRLKQEAIAYNKTGKIHSIIPNQRWGEV